MGDFQRANQVKTTVKIAKMSFKSALTRLSTVGARGMLTQRVYSLNAPQKQSCIWVRGFELENERNSIKQSDCSTFQHSLIPTINFTKLFFLISSSIFNIFFKNCGTCFHTISNSHKIPSSG